MTELPNAPLSFRWYDALFNTARFQRYIANVQLMESHIHMLRGQVIKDGRELDRRAEKLDECLKRIATLTGPATEQNTPYQVRGSHGLGRVNGNPVQDRPMDRPIDAVRSTEGTDTSRTQDNSALLAVAAVMLMSDDVQAAPEPEIPAQAAPEPCATQPEAPAYCAPAYVAPEPSRESYSPPSRDDSSYGRGDDSPSSSGDSGGSVSSD